MSAQTQESNSPSASESSSDIVAASGANLSGEKALSDRHILIVEDNKADVFLMREALSTVNLSGHLDVVSDGEKALRFIDAADADSNATGPVFFILDLNLPKRHGLEVLEHLRKSRKCSGSLVLIVTSSDSATERKEATRLGANGYFRKPSDYVSYLKLGEVVRTMLDADTAAPK